MENAVRSLLSLWLGLPAVFAIADSGFAADPMLDSWFTRYSGRYARIYETEADALDGNSKTTWRRGSISQTAPAYSGVQEIYSSGNWLYIRTTGLGSHVQGPWYLDVNKTMVFPNLPANTHTLYRFPRTPAVPSTKTLTGLGVIGYFVDGVALFDGRDAFYWNGTTETQGSGLWNRDAYVNEAPSFDRSYAHQEQTGTYHCHANPIALRFLLGDHVAFNASTKTYSHDPANLHHSPLLGWVRDGMPIYGPYGYSNATNPTSGVRRMISGYVLRNGASGTVNLATTGRATLPAWAGRAYNRTTTLAAADYGPAVGSHGSQYPLGRYLEDNEYQGDLGRTQGTDFDLDEYNGRYCVTPEFPNGTYAYFVTIAENGASVFPYNVGRSFYGNPSGGGVTSVTEPVTTNFVGGANCPIQINAPARNPANNEVTLTWSAVEGGTYRVEGSEAIGSWTVLASNVSPQQILGRSTNNTLAAQQFYRVARTALATYDPVTGTTTGGGGGITSVAPNSGSRGATVTVTINLNSSVNPPPQNAPVNSATIGAINGTNLQHLSQTQVRGAFAIPADAPTGAQTVTVVFPGPPGNPTQTVTYTLAGGFTIN
jgi:hypothetical protein